MKMDDKTANKLIVSMDQLNSTLKEIAINTQNNILDIQKDVIKLVQDSNINNREIKELKTSTKENTENINSLSIVIERLNNTTENISEKMDGFNETIKVFNQEIKKINDDPGKEYKKLKMCGATATITALISTFIAAILQLFRG